MTDAKIEFCLGTLSFSGEGEAKWLGEQLDKVLGAAGELVENRLVVPETAFKTNQVVVQEKGNFQTSLGTYLKEKVKGSNQVERFLATADWLRQRDVSELTTALVTKSLKDNHQNRLSNPSDCLNKNVAKGFCEKKGKSFFITPEGLKKLGHA